MPKSNVPDRARSPSVAAAARMLAVLARPGYRDASLTRVCTAAEVPTSTGFGILKTLEDADLVAFTPETKTYRLGTGLLALALAAEPDQVAMARPHMEHLVDETGLTALVIRPSERGLLVVDRVESRETVLVTSAVGQELPVTAGALGKAYLAFLPEPTRHRLLERQGPPRFTAHSLGDREVFERDLRQVARRGFAESYEEYSPGVNALATVAFDHRGQVALVLGLLGLAPLLPPEAMRAHGHLLRSTARRVTAALGGQPPDHGGQNGTDTGEERES